MSTDQEMLLTAVDRMFADYQERGSHGWTESLGDLGLELLFRPESEGGFGGSWSDALVVLKLVGRYRIDAPVAETLLASCLLSGAGLSCTNAPYSVSACFEGTLDQNEDDAITASGTMRNVAWGEDVNGVVFAGKLGQKSCLAVISPQAAAARSSGTNLAGESRAHLTYKDAIVSDAVVLEADCELFLYGALMRTCQAAGALNFVLELTVSHANEREQFGRPIGKFQAVQQNLAVLAGEVAAVNCAASAASHAVQFSAGRFEVAAAKLRMNQAVGRATSIAHQTLGAIGITREHVLHQSTQRLWSWRSEYGNDRYWSRWLGKQIKARGAEHLWSDMTAAGGRSG